MPEEETKLKTVRADSVKLGSEFNFNGVLVKLVELNPLKHSWGAVTYTLSYKIIDTRIRPVFISAVACLFLEANSNVTEEMRKVVNLYEATKETIHGVILPKVEEKQ